MTAYLAAGSVPQIPPDWPGWAILAVLFLVAVGALKKWFKS